MITSRMVSRPRTLEDAVFNLERRRYDMFVEENMVRIALADISGMRVQIEEILKECGNIHTTSEVFNKIKEFGKDHNSMLAWFKSTFIGDGWHFLKNEGLDELSPNFAHLWALICACLLASQGRRGVPKVSLPEAGVGCPAAVGGKDPNPGTREHSLESAFEHHVW
jgi:hypothetical protein